MSDRDYHDFTTKDTPVAERRRLNVGDLWINAARCNSCQEVVRSRNKHDFRTCSCGSLSVDGGSWYAKRATRGDAGFTDLCELYADAEEGRERG